MKIIKHGKIKETIIRFECPRCGCVFEERALSCTRLVDDGTLEWGIRCPECRTVVLSNEEVSTNEEI